MGLPQRALLPLRIFPAAVAALFLVLVPESNAPQFLFPHTDKFLK